jgi:translation initiation factor 5B
MKEIRSPILVALGHVDHGKTSLLDKVRGTAVAKTEPGLITQYISASYIPIQVIRGMCGTLMDAIKGGVEIPGLLWIDSPGHEAFTTLRKRGGAIADLAVLVIDVNEGFQPQTDESLNFLKQFRTPFVVAATKIDRMLGWNTNNRNACFFDSLKSQTDRAQEELETKLYRLIGQLGERGFPSDRFDRVDDYTKKIAVVPVSNVTGEGIPDLLMILAGVAQRYLKKRLETTPGEGKGTVLEVKDYKGLGSTIDVILYDGEMRKGDNLIIGGENTVRTKVKALLEPEPLKELRMEKSFRPIDSVSAAAGIKISAPGLDSVIAGSPIRAVSNDRDIERAVREVEAEVSEVEIRTDKEGFLLKADTLGSLEALIKTMREKGIKVRKAQVGTVTKSDVSEIRTLKEPLIFSFGLKVPEDIATFAKDNNVMIFSSDVIYSLIEYYEKWSSEKKLREEKALLASVSRPARIRVLPGYVFRQNKPAVFGIEVQKGIIRPGVKLTKKGKIVGEVKELQKEGDNVPEAEAGERLAISSPDMTVGKDIEEGDELEVFLNRHDKEVLEKLKHKLRGDEKELLEEV